MASFREIALLLVWIGSVAAIGFGLSWGQAAFVAIFSVLWFVISMVLLYRPPGIPAIIHHDTEDDDATVTRTEAFEVLPAKLRLRISLCFATAVSSLIGGWMAWLG